MLRIGMVGLGNMGQGHFSRVQASGLGRVVAVADVEPDRRAGHAPVSGNIEMNKKVLDLTGIEQYADGAALIDRAEVDAVFICLPTSLHASMSIRALRRGLHVFCEKPIALTLDEADAMLAAAREADRRLLVGQVLRFWPEFQYLKDAIVTGRLGALRSVAFQRVGGVPRWSWHNWMRDPAQSGAALIDLHIHDVDVIQWLLGMPKRISVQGWNLGSTPDGIDFVDAGFDYGPDVTVRARGGWINLSSYGGFEAGYDAVFEHGWLRYGGVDGPALIEYNDKDAASVHPSIAGDAYANEVRFFLECLTTGRDPALVISPEDARNTLKLVLSEAEIIHGINKMVSPRA
jgi:predicted dehydrogenase